jgi:hypothetical protein
MKISEKKHFLKIYFRALMQNKEVFCTLIGEFDLRFDKEQPDYLEAVSALMIFLQRIMIIEILPDSPYEKIKFEF